MSWLLRHNWLWALLAFLLGALITWLLLVRRVDTATEAEPVRRPADDRDLVPATATSTASAATTTPEPSVVAAKPKDDKPATKASEATPVTKPKESKQPATSAVTGAELDEDVPPPDDSAESSADASTADSSESDEGGERSAPYGEGSAAALADGSAPEGFTIKGNADSMLYHTKDSPSYGRTKAEAWFRTEKDAERAGFTRWNRRDRGGTDDKESGAAPVAGPTKPDEPSPPTTSAAVTGAELNEDDSAESSNTADTGADTPAESPADSSAGDSSGDDDAADDAAGAATGTADDEGGKRSAPYGEGSAAALADGNAPEGFTIKGNADSMLYHTTDSPYYGRTKAEAWFRTEKDAERAGFTRWDRRKNSGADTAAAEPVVPPGAYGEGSADPLPDGSAPAGFTIKGNAGSMLFHPADSPHYGRTKAEIWFRTEADATRAGFTHWDRN